MFISMCQSYFEKCENAVKACDVHSFDVKPCLLEIKNLLAEYEEKIFDNSLICARSSNCIN